MKTQATVDFVEFLVSLSVDGETPLIVRQKPKLSDGQFEFHADGAIKCTWPAFLPESIHKMSDGQAWYGNTASFIIDRFQNGKVSAAAANCEFCLVMVLDDIGTKAKVPPLEPTWKMETSAGSFQWGYVFSKQPTKNEFAAAIRAIADAGYTDPGAVNAVRNFRLPGSTNLKPNRDSFVSKLAEFHREREFTLDEICEALDVTPAEPDTNFFKPIRVTDTGNDDVFAWLSDKGMVLSAANSSGWAGIICPNSVQHSDGNPEAGYRPSVRAFSCLHSHCVDFDTKIFLRWVADNGGPERESGLRDDLMATVMNDALQKLEPSSFFSDDAAKVIEEVEQKELGRVDKANWYDRFAYIMSDNAYFDMQERREFTRGTFDALFRHVSCRSIHNGRKIESSTCFDENRQAKGARTLVGITYAAGEGMLVARDGEVYGNRWRNARPQPTDGDITPWLEHCQVLVPEPAELEHIFNVMAYKVQHPEVKINHAVLHGGDEGCGKDTMWAPFIWSVCGSGLKNRGLLDNDTINGQWGYQFESEILIINELKEPEAAARRALANKLKPIIAAPPEMLSINRKGLHPYDMMNRMFVLAFSNDSVPISIGSQDRRWFCVWSAAPRIDDDEAKKLWAWYKGGGFGAIAGWLHKRDVSAFNPAAAPAWTEFKHNLVEHGMSMAESYLVEQMRSRRGEFARGVVGSPFHALCDRLLGAAPTGVKIPQAALLHALKEAGWVDMGRVASGELPSKKHLFCSPDMVGKASKSDMRRMVEETSASRMTIIK
jgi:hypothetical protein